MGKPSRDKGKRGEREAAKALRDTGLFPHAQRSYHQSRDGGDEADLENTGPLWVEVKRQKRPNIHAALAQAIEESEGTGRFPCVLSRREREPWNITMRLEDLAEWIRGRE